MPGKQSEILVGFGFAKQAAIATANTVAGIWRLGNLNKNFIDPVLSTEDDADESGKGHEFATDTFKTSWDVGGTIEKYASSDFAAWVMAFGLGGVTPTGTLPNYIYTCIPIDPATDGLELPYFSYVEQIRPGASAILNRIAIGCAINDWALSVASGPGRVSAKLSANIVGSGKFTEPSGITMPSATAEKLLPSASLLCTINGVDYVTNKNIVSLEATWNNNLNLADGFFPGSGFQGAVKQIDTITLTGTSGTATVTLAGGLTKTVTFNGNLTTTADDFMDSFASDYLAQGIVVTVSGATIIFTANVAGTAFVSPAIANATGNLAGTVFDTQSNSNLSQSGAVRGRIEIGEKRECGLTFVARFDEDSDELTKLRGQTKGTAVISLTYDANNLLQLTYHRVSFAVAKLGEVNGIITVQVTVKAMWHTNNHLLTAVAKCNTTGIAALES